MEINLELIEHLKRNIYKYLLGLMVFFLFVLPLFSVRITSGHDALFHTSRINNIAANIRNGEWFAPIYYGHNNGYGYGAPLFYGDILLHIPAIFKALGMKTELSLRLFLIMCGMATAAASYYSAKRIFKTNEAAFTTAVIYTFSSYFIIDAIERVAVGETQAFIFLPLTVLGFYSIFLDDKRYWLWLPVGLYGLLISHSLSAVITVIFLAIAAIILLYRVFGDVKIFYYILLSILLFALLAASFILPYFEQINHNDFRFNDGTAEVANGTLEQRATPIRKVFNDFVLFQSRAEGEQWVPNGIGLLVFASVFMVTVAVALKGKFVRSLVFTAAAVGTLLLTSELFPWGNYQDVFGILQFPWRLLLFATLFIAIVGGCLVWEMREKLSVRNAFMLVLVICALVSYFGGGINTFKLMQNRSTNPEYADRYETVMYSVGSGQEYLPSGSVYADFGKRGQRVTSNDETVTISYDKNYTNIQAKFTNNTNQAYLEFPFIMYKGYTARLSTGELLEVGYGENNVVRVYLGEHESGIVTVGYERTNIQIISYIVTISAICGIIGYLIYRKLFHQPKAIALLL